MTGARRVAVGAGVVAIVAVTASAVASLVDADLVCAIAYGIVCAAIAVLVAAQLREHRRPARPARRLDRRPSPYRRRGQLPAA